MPTTVTANDRDHPEIDSDLDLDIEESTTSRGQYRATVTGVAGGGDQRVKVRATNGDVIIRRQ